MTDRAYVISRALEDKIAIAENNDQNTLIVTLDVLKEILAMLKEREAEIAFFKEMQLQLQTVHNMSNEDIGNAVRNVLRL